MAGYGQFCAVARTHDAVGGRWTLLVVRELLLGSRRFNDIRRGIPRISRTLLSQRLQELIALGAVRQEKGDYVLTDAGRELSGIVGALATWGQRWLPRQAEKEDLDLEPLLLDLQRRVLLAALPKDPLVVRFRIRGRGERMLLLRSSEASLCSHNPGFPELVLTSPLATLAGWWRGDFGWLEAQRRGLSLEGPKGAVRAFPRWFDRYLFAGVAPAAAA